MMLLIVISLAVLPGLLADVLTTVRKQNGTYDNEIMIDYVFKQILY